MAMPMELKYVLLGNAKLKSVIKITKISELYKHMLEKEVVVEVNEAYFEKIGEEPARILISQELTKIAVDMDSGKLTLVSPDVITFSSIIKKFGAEDVLNANELIKLLHMQEEEAKKEKAAEEREKKKEAIAKRRGKVQAQTGGEEFFK